jgi:DNA-directed RNA polymerase subunit RPC12/RpoP
VVFAVSGGAEMRVVKCPICGYALELHNKTKRARFYRCTTCGKQVEVKIDENERKSEESGEND